MNTDKIKDYSSATLVDFVTELQSHTHIPKDFWILGIQSKEDTFDNFDDKFFLFHHTVLMYEASGTTNAGLAGLKHYNKYNSKGCAVIKTNEWYYNLWSPGLHRGRMKALRQVRPIKFYRDGNKDNVVNEGGTLHNGIIGINFHTVTYGKKAGFFRKLIGGWSTGCQVVNNINDYYAILDLIDKQKFVSYCLIKEL